MKKIIAIVLAALMVCCLFAGCNKTDSDTTTGADDTTTAADGTTAPAAEGVVKVIDIPLTDELYAFGVKKDDPELLASVNSFIADIKSDGTLDKVINSYFGDGEKKGVTSAAEDSSADQLIITTNAAFPPFEYLEGDTYYGIDIELAALLAEKLNKQLVIKNIEFDSVCTTVGSGYADIAIAGLTINEKRTEFVTFSDSYYTASQLVIVPTDDTTFDACKQASDVEAILKTFDNTKKIGVQTGTTAQYYVKGDADWGFDGFATDCKGYDSGALAVQDLINKNLDLVIIDQAPAQYIVNSINSVN